MRKLTVFLLAVVLIGCNKAPTETSAPVASDEPVAVEVPPNHLATVLAAQPVEVAARYQYRHPQATMDFFGITPGMTVMEALPGGGWYSKILLAYLGEGGHLIGADYALDMYPKFNFYDDDYLEAKKTWVTDWAADAESWGEDATVSAFVLGSMPDKLSGTADAVLFIRALHNLSSFETDGEYLTTALQDAYRILKPGGIVGVVQHQSGNDMPDDWADGSNGYLKEGFVVSRMQAAGFEFMSGSGINANDKDQPTSEEDVWRLPPTLFDMDDKAELKAAMQAIGESNRMTLKFGKPE